MCVQCVSVSVWMYILIYKHSEATAGCLASSAVALCFTTLRQGLSRNEKLGVLDNLAVQYTLRTQLSLFSNTRVIGLQRHVWLFAWLLEIQTQVLMSAEQGLLPTKLSSQPSLVLPEVQNFKHNLRPLHICIMRMVHSIPTNSCVSDCLPVYQGGLLLPQISKY